MKTAILIIAMYYNSMTSQIVPADKCEDLAKQFLDNKWGGSRATCIYFDQENSK